MADYQRRSFSGDVMVMQPREALDLSCVPFSAGDAEELRQKQRAASFRSVPLRKFQML